jgi:hypothetical protein
MHHQWTPSIRALRPAEIDCFGRHLCRLETDAAARFRLSVPDVFLRVTPVAWISQTPPCLATCRQRNARGLRAAICSRSGAVRLNWPSRSEGQAGARHRHRDDDQAIRTTKPWHRPPVPNCHRHNRGVRCIAGKFIQDHLRDSECFADIAVHCQPMSPLLDAGDSSTRRPARWSYWICEADRPEEQRPRDREVRATSQPSLRADRSIFGATRIALWFKTIGHETWYIIISPHSSLSRSWFTFSSGDIKHHSAVGRHE